MQLGLMSSGLSLQKLHNSYLKFKDGFDQTLSMNTMSSPIIFNSNTIELTEQSSWYWVLDLLCVI